MRWWAGSRLGPDGSGGDVRIGGGPRGADPATPNAANTVIGASAVIDASASSPQGSGGTVTVWADNATRFEGRISATGGDAGGNGGSVEVSGRKSLVFNPLQAVDLRAALGELGTLLLDPDAYTIGTTNTSNSISVATLQSQLASGNVKIETSTSLGDISIVSPIAWSNASTL